MARLLDVSFNILADTVDGIILIIVPQVTIFDNGQHHVYIITFLHAVVRNLCDCTIFSSIVPIHCTTTRAGVRRGDGFNLIINCTALMITVTKICYRRILSMPCYISV